LRKAEKTAKESKPFSDKSSGLFRGSLPIIPLWPLC
jgi:hypothetical protein